MVSDSFIPRVDGIAVATLSRLRELGDAGLLAGVLAGSSDRVAANLSMPKRANRRVIETYGRTTPYPAAFISASALSAVMAEWRVEVVEVHTLGPLGLSAMHVAQDLRIPIRLYWHTDLVAYAKNFPVRARSLLVFAAALSQCEWPRQANIVGATKRALGELLSQVQWVVAPSLKAMRSVQGLGYLGPVELRRTPLTVAFPQDAGATPSPNGPFLYVGRVSREKNIKLLVEAFSSAKQVQPEAKLRLVGPTEDSRALRIVRLAQQRHPGAIDLVGAVPHDLVFEEIRHSLALVMPSMTEMQCLALREALASKSASLVVDRELAQEYDAGDLIRVTDPNVPCLAEAMVALLREVAAASSPYRRAPLLSTGVAAS